MSFIFKDRISISIFGSSHGEAVGAVIDGIPAGYRIEQEFIQKWMERRAPGRSTITTQRKERDNVKIISGINNGYTDGGSIALMIQNEDVISKHYDELKERPRPGHGDLSLYLKYGEYRNYSGGGFLSGRMTAPLVASGAIALQVLISEGINIVSYLEQIGDLKFTNANPDEEKIYELETRMGDSSYDAKAREMIMSLISNGDSVGGVVKTLVSNVPGGMGEPFFDSVESILSHLIFSIPGVKGIEFGSGFAMSGMRGSETNDPFKWNGKNFYTSNNRNGGVLGGITYGDPVEFRVAMKPTSSIRMEQDTINLITHQEEKIRIKGRHDPCIAIRAVPVITCVTAIGILDLYLRMKSSHKGYPENYPGD
ncbi:chorismate synthase [Cuniculiplasma sp. SKW4]|uniref:chorismate synthase n=1 Tax=Cuniculiplasma sp. SKW4 TaxID=3400171 RepID=UPI003FD57003